VQGNSAAGDLAAAARAQIVEMRASEFRFDPDQVMVRSGVIRFVVRNIGEVRHVLSVEWEGGGGASIRIAPSQTQTLEVTLERPGSYVFFCPLETEGEGSGMIVHRDKGMEGRLIVAQE
jgi:plastocyanin